MGVLIKSLYYSMRKCSKCKETKEKDLFGLIKVKNKIYSHSICKKCKNKMKEDRLKDKNKRSDKYIIKRAKISRKTRLRVKYNMTIEEYDNLLLLQNNVCKICFKEETAVNFKGNIQMLSVDHCHTTGKVRGLLCSNCNTGLGMFKDNPEYLENAIKYLKENC